MAPEITTDLLRAHAEALCWHAARLAGLAEDVQRRNGREFVSPVTWLQAAKADLQELGGPARILRQALPYAIAAVPRDIRDTPLRTSHACGLLAGVARAGVETSDPASVKPRSRRYPTTVLQTRALPATLRRAGTKAVELSQLDPDSLARLEAENDRNAASAVRMNRDAQTPVRPDAELSPGAADQLQLCLQKLAEERAPVLDISAFTPFGIEEPLPVDRDQPTAILLAIDTYRDPFRATIIRSTSPSDSMQPGRVFTGDDNDRLAGFLSVGYRIYVARAGHEYEAHATCATHPWGRTPAQVDVKDVVTGRTLSTTYGGDSLYAWAERFERTGEGRPPSQAAMKLYRATNACPVCNLPHGPQITRESRAEVDTYRRALRSARQAYYNANRAWPGQKGQTSNERLLVTVKGNTAHLGPEPEPVLEGALYRVTSDAQAAYVERAETFWRAKGGKVPKDRDQQRQKWHWLAKQLGPRPQDRFTVALDVHVDREAEGPYCVGELEREQEAAQAQAALDVQHLQRA